MIDIVFPKDNEKDFIRMAERLGLEGLCFVYDKVVDVSSFQKMTKLKISSGILCRPEDVRKYKGKFLTLVRAPDDQMKIRHIIEQARPDILFDLEFSNKKDFIHHRASGLNHVLAALAAEKGVAIGFDFSRLLSAAPEEKAVYIGRMRQNIRFAKKFGFTVTLASFGDTIFNQRSKTDLNSWFKVLGGNDEQTFFQDH